MSQQHTKPAKKFHEKQVDNKQVKQFQNVVAKGNPKIDGKVVKGYN